MFDEEHPPPHLPFKHWMRYMAAVPKGFLRYQVLELLNEKPLSDSEITNEIEKKTKWMLETKSRFRLPAFSLASRYKKV